MAEEIGAAAAKARSAFLFEDDRHLDDRSRVRADGAGRVILERIEGPAPR